MRGKLCNRPNVYPIQRYKMQQGLTWASKALKDGTSNRHLQRLQWYVTTVVVES